MRGLFIKDGTLEMCNIAQIVMRGKKYKSTTVIT